MSPELESVESIPVRGKICRTCPFRPDTTVPQAVLDEVRRMGKSPCMFGHEGKGRVHVCHSTANSDQPMVCRGSAIVNSSIHLP